MALETVNKIKQAEKSSADESAWAQKRAEEYITRSKKEAESKSAEDIETVQQERIRLIDVTKKQVKETLNIAKVEADKIAQGLLESVKSKESNVINEIIEIVVN